MSFSLRASNPLLSQRSSVSQPYVSPQMLPQSAARQNMPLFSLSGTEDVCNNNSNNIPIKKVGTDPTRYKTTMCRNWEAGTCTFKGCTFAHGVEELRAPTRGDHYRSPNLDPRRSSPGQTPPLYATAVVGSSGSPKIEQLLEMLYTEVVRERDLVTVHVEANRTLETLLKKEQMLHDEAKSQLEAARLKVNELTRVILQTSEEISTFLDSCTLDEKQRSRIAALSNKMTEVIPEHDCNRDTADEEKNRVRELLKALQHCQKPTDA
ncbi:zinc finger-domain protein [Trypanosoma grayi]|uniref:zinc finger-domain protein n=1 Tax=Trypanosoma grayi TaxID=71804 RepID=UPI0004F3FC23|nr:zinc finger-domain protein [Trypanosoma grayi]KEG15469.1 zinc finger-domain protein [Trypanosoma grayi]